MVLRHNTEELQETQDDHCSGKSLQWEPNMNPQVIAEMLDKWRVQNLTTGTHARDNWAANRSMPTPAQLSPMEND